MPVVPVMAALGTAVTAGVATGTTAAVIGGVAAAGVAAKGYGMVQQNKAAKAAAKITQDVASYNAAVDLAEAKQVELDTSENIIRARREARVYGSRQQAAYAAAGVLNTGSALAVQAETAGRLEQEAQQMKINAGREAARRESAARVGVLYGDAQASAIRTQNKIAMLKGGIDILSTIGGAYNSGMFSAWGKQTGTT